MEGTKYPKVVPGAWRFRENVGEVVKQITMHPFNVIYRVVYPFLISLVFACVLLFIFPAIATWLPHLLMQ